MKFIKGRGSGLAPLGVVALAVTLSACGGASTPKTSDADASKAGKSDLCRLVSRAEAQDALGKPLNAGIATSGQTAAGLSGGCKYLGTTVNPKTSSKGIVQVIILGTKITRAQYDQLATSEGKVGASDEAKPVPGLSETAFYVPGLITTFDHGLAMSVQMVRDDLTTPSLAELTKLAHKALDRAGDLR